MPRCEETLYGNNAETVVGKRNTESRLRLFYASKSYESVLEKLAYKGVPLFCDIGKKKSIYPIFMDTTVPIWVFS